MVGTGTFVAEQAAKGFQEVLAVGEIFGFGRWDERWIAIGKEPSCQVGGILGFEVEVGHRIRCEMGVGLEEVSDQCVGGEGASQVMEGDAFGGVRGAGGDVAGGTTEGIEQGSADGGLGCFRGGGIGLRGRVWGAERGNATGGQVLNTTGGQVLWGLV